jgi:hypothetical protein
MLKFFDERASYVDKMFDFFYDNVKYAFHIPDIVFLMKKNIRLLIGEFPQNYLRIILYDLKQIPHKLYP